MAGKVDGRGHWGARQLLQQKGKDQGGIGAESIDIEDSIRRRPSLANGKCFGSVHAQDH